MQRTPINFYRNSWPEMELERRENALWIDLQEVSDTQLERLVTELKLSQTAIHHLSHHQQRPRIFEENGCLLLVFYSVEYRNGETLPVEVKLLLKDNLLLTVHGQELPALMELGELLEREGVAEPAELLYRVIEVLNGQFFPVLTEIDAEIDTLEDAVIESPNHQQLQRIFGIKRDLVALRKVVAPQRDMFAHPHMGLSRSNNAAADGYDFGRDIYDHLIRISELIDSYRDLLSSATDLYLSTVSNRQNEVTKQLTILGTVFLPLTFITGFFGQNFGWMTRNITDSAAAFWVLGIGSVAATCIAATLFFKRKGWM